MDYNWLLYISAFASAFAITLVTTPLAKMHKKPMPRMGGIAIVMGFMITVLVLYRFNPEMNVKQFAGFVMGASIIVVLGMIDDVKNLRARLKFCVQIVAALIVIYSGTRINVVMWPVTTYLQTFSVPITLVWIVGVTNAVNLIDGLDGLAAGVSSIAALCLMILCIMTGSTTAVMLTASLAGACLGFLPRNFNPAEIFMGDTGSTFLGFVLAVTSILGVFKGYAILALIVSMLCLGLPRGHLHHRLIDKGLSQRQAVLILYIVSLLCGLLAIFISFKDSRTIVVVVLTIIVLSILIYYFNAHIKNKNQ